MHEMPRTRTVFALAAKDTDKSTVTLSTDRPASPPLYQRVPRGWLIVGLLIAAWVAVWLIWNGITLLSHI